MKQFLLLILFGIAIDSFAILPLPFQVDLEEDEPVRIHSKSKRDPRSIQGYSELYSGSQLREMELPHFENPENTLGFQKDTTFKVPPKLRNRVNFWKKIYSEYTTTQAVLHDSKFLNVIYKVVDLSDIAEKSNLSKRQKRRQINRRLRDEKKIIKRQLLSLDAFRDQPLNIPFELFSLFKKFQHVKQRNKFLLSATRVRAQIGQRDKIVQGFFYGGKYFNEMIRIFGENNLPKELTRLTLVESAFDIRARSKVGASGVWQFTRATGKRFLTINRSVDERNDPIAATHAAAALLKLNYNSLKAWPLAITAYNHGRAGMERAVRTLSTRDISTIIHKYKSRTFGFASSNFYPSFLAILEVEKEYRKHFGQLMVDSPIRYETVSTQGPMTLRQFIRQCSVGERELASLNLGFSKWLLSGRGKLPKQYPVKIPPRYAEDCRSTFNQRE